MGHWKPSPPSDETTHLARESGMVVSGPRAPARVLVADDDEESRGALKLLLTDEGYEVIEAADGREVLEILATAADEGTPPFDVLLLDFVMPALSGLGVMRVMRRFERVPPTIIMTAFPDESVGAFAQSLGAIRVLRKPLDVDEVIASVLEAVHLAEQSSRPSKIRGF